MKLRDIYRESANNGESVLITLEGNSAAGRLNMKIVNPADNEASLFLVEGWSVSNPNQKNTPIFMLEGSTVPYNGSSSNWRTEYNFLADEIFIETSIAVAKCKMYLIGKFVNKKKATKIQRVV